MTISIEDLKDRIERQYVGFSPSTEAVKPVHIANGLFRHLRRQVADTRRLHRFVFYQTDKGKAPEHHKLEQVYDDLLESGGVADDIDQQNLMALRTFLKKVVAADKAVFTGAMQSYTSGNPYFLSNDTIAQNGGEFFGEWLMRRSPELRDVIVNALDEDGDIISLLASPLLDHNLTAAPATFDYDQLLLFRKNTLKGDAAKLSQGLAAAAGTLALGLQRNSDKMVKLRLAVLFGGFVLIRQMSSLEAIYAATNNSVPPLLLDFTQTQTHPIAIASRLTYALVDQSISRFYEWAFGQLLADDFGNPNELRREKTPTYMRGKQNADENKQADEVWQIALSQLKHSQPQEGFKLCGRAIFEILAQKAEGTPIGYLRRLGLHIGLLYPPNQPPRFVVKQDFLEVLLRSVLKPGEVTDMNDLLDRLWDGYRIVIGGRIQDGDRLRKAGIHTLDGTALMDNRQGFAIALSKLNFAHLLADGVLKVGL